MLDSPGSITEGDQSSIKVFRQTFPYFVPIRYLEAVESNKGAAYSPDMLTAIHPYMGNWILFCDFLEAGNREPMQVAAQENTTAEGEDFFQLIRGELAETDILPDEEQVTEEEPEVAAEVAVQEHPATEPVNEQEVIKDEDEEVENEITEEIPAEPEVAVSEAFLQLIREEGLGNSIENAAEKPVEPVHIEPVAIVPQPVFESQSETDHNIEIAETGPASANGHEYTHPAVHTETEEAETEEIVSNTEEQPPLIYPIYTQDYFLQQGEKVSDELPAEISDLIENGHTDEEDKSLMVMMSFSEWLLHFKNTSRKQEEEKKDQKALKTMWQKEKLAAAIEEENEEIPENVFEMAVNSIAKEDGLASESLADIYIKQGKYDKAIDMYRKLSLRNPQKNAYFARKIEEVLKDKQS